MASPATTKSSTGTTLERFRQELTCTCGKLYNEPKTLPCLHSFCAKCLEGHVQEQLLSDHSGESQETFDCHICKNQYKLPGADVSELPTNRSYKNLVSHLTCEDNVTSEQGLKCEECEEGNAVILCRDCNLPLCEVCQRHHSKSKRTREHVMNELRARSSSSDSCEGVSHKTWMCDKHNSMQVCIYCLTCDMVVCRDCALVDHKNGHEKQFASKVIDEPENRPKIKEHLGNTDKVRSDFKQAIKDLNDMKESLRMSKEETTRDAGKHYNEIKARHRKDQGTNVTELDQKKEDLLHKVNSIFTKKMSILDQQLQELQDIERTLEEGLKFTDDILAVGIAEEILFLKTQIIQRLEALCNKYGPYPRAPKVRDVIFFSVAKDEDTLGTVFAAPPIPAFATNLSDVHFIDGQPAVFKVICKDVGNPSPENTQDISVEFKPETEGTGEIVPGVVKKGEVGDYLVSVTPQNHGPHTMSIFISVNSLPVHIKDSPFSVTVAPPTVKETKAVNVITGDNVPEGKMKRPWGIAVNKMGDIVVSDIENHCIIVFDQNVRFVRTFGKEGNGNVEFKSPRGLAFNGSGHILVAEKENHRVQVLTIDGVFKFRFGRIGSGSGQFHGPTDVAVGKDGTIFVTDSFNQRIQFFTSKGTFVGVIGQWGSEPGMVNEPYAIAVDPRGRIVVTERQGCRVQVFEKSGSAKAYKSLYHFGSEGSAKRQLNMPVGVALDTRNNYIFVTELQNQRVSIFSLNGGFISCFGSRGMGLGEFHNPMGIALLLDSRIIVADCANGRLQSFRVFDGHTTDFQPPIQMKKRSDKMERPWGIVVSRDHIYASDTANHCITVFNRDMGYVKTYGQQGSKDLEFNSPMGLALNHEDQIIVADKDNHRVQVITLLGEFVHTFGRYGRGHGQFQSPTDVAATSDGSVFVTDSLSQCIQYFQPDGTSLGIITTEASGIEMPFGLFVDKEDRILVTDRKGSQIKMFKKYGERYRPFLQFGKRGSNPGCLNEPVGIALDPHTSCIFITEVGNKRVSVFTPTGNFLHCFGSTRTNDFTDPIGIAVLDTSTLVVADSDSGFLLAFDFTAATKEHDDILRKLEACLKVMEEKGSIPTKSVKLILSGLPLSGKSTLKHRLLEENPPTDFSLSIDGDRGARSTPVAETALRVIIKKVGFTIAVKFESKWILQNFDDEKARLLQSILNAVDASYSIHVHPPGYGRIEGGLQVREGRDQSVTVTLSETTLQEPHSEAPKLLEQATFSPDLELSEQQASIPVHQQPQEILTDALTNPSKQDEIESLFQNSTTLHIIDTGGQPEFTEILQTLVTGPSVNLLVFNLNQSLEKRYTVEYIKEDGERSEPYTSSVTTEEMLFKSLSSFSCAAVHDRLASCNLTLFVGTHRDRVSQEVVQRVDADLQHKVKNAAFYQHDRKLVHFIAPDRLVVPVDNTKCQDEEVANLRNVVNEIIDKEFSTIPIPAAWLLFDHALRSSEAKYLSFKQCLDMGREFGIQREEELRQVLWYLHHQLGSLRYYSEVEGLQDLVIIDLQLLFVSITKLITSTFTFNSVGLQTHQRFKTTGQFPVGEVEWILQDPKSIPLPKLVKLLQHLHIIAPVTDERGDVTHYFMPCVLKTFPVETLTRSTSALPPLLVMFECGYCPVGVFCALMAHIISEHSHTSFKWRLMESNVYRNKITFHVGKDCDKVTLLSRPTFYEIRIEREMKTLKPVALPEVCNEVRKVIMEGIRHAKSSLNYSLRAKYHAGFYCSQCEGPAHPAICDEDQPHTMQCSVSSEPMPVCQEHLIWYGEVSPLSSRKTAVLGQVF